MFWLFFFILASYLHYLGMMMNFFNDWFTSIPSFVSEQNVRTEEKEDEYVVMVDAAGIPKESIKISKDGSILSIQGEGSWKNINYKLRMPIVLKEIEATTKDGILEIKIKKTKEKEPKYIEVH